MRLLVSSLLAGLIVVGCSGEKQSNPSKVLWDAESSTDESESTHLWIVNRALDILNLHSDQSPGAAMISRMNEPECRDAWQRGLLDADFKAAYNGGTADLAPGTSAIEIGAAAFSAGSTWASHFYDPDTGLNYKGQSSPTAFTQTMLFASASSMIGQDPSVDVGAFNESSPCYDLGLSLHYFTDLTQPMHAANFTTTDRPKFLHSNFESYATRLQSRYPADDWSGTPDVPLDGFVKEVAQNSKGDWTNLLQAFASAYVLSHDSDPLNCGDLTSPAVNIFLAQQIDHPECWQNNGDVDFATGNSLLYAQDVTAQFIYLLGLRDDTLQ